MNYASARRSPLIDRVWLSSLVGRVTHWNRESPPPTRGESFFINRASRCVIDCCGTRKHFVIRVPDSDVRDLPGNCQGPARLPFFVLLSKEENATCCLNCTSWCHCLYYAGANMASSFSSHLSLAYTKSRGPLLHLPADCSFIMRPLHLPNLAHLPNQGRDEVFRRIDTVTSSYRSFAHCRRFQCQDWADAVPTADQITVNVEPLPMSSPDNVLRQ